MKSYKKRLTENTGIKVNNATTGMRLEDQVSQMIANKEPIKGDAPLLYTDRKEGVLPGTNIRTDKWEIAVTTMDKISRSSIAKRTGNGKTEHKEIVGDESTQGKPEADTKGSK